MKSSNRMKITKTLLFSVELALVSTSLYGCSDSDKHESAYLNHMDTVNNLEESDIGIEQLSTDNTIVDDKMVCGMS